jgi:hypothetical protein
LPSNQEDQVPSELWDIVLSYEAGFDVAVGLQLLMDDLRQTFGVQLVDARAFPPDGDARGALQVRLCSPLLVLTRDELHAQLLPLWERIRHRTGDEVIVCPCALNQPMDMPSFVGTPPVALETDRFR